MFFVEDDNEATDVSQSMMSSQSPAQSSGNHSILILRL